LPRVPHEALSGPGSALVGPYIAVAVERLGSLSRALRITAILLDVQL
jgi:hypothetical protein